MTIILKPTQEQKDEMSRSLALSKMKENWGTLLEVIFEDSTLEEILAFALRLKEIPHYTSEEEFARDFLRQEGTHIRRFYSEHGCSGGYWEEHKEEPVKLIELPQGLIEKGSKSWKIKI